MLTENQIEDLFMGQSPQEKFYDILFGTSKTAVKQELDQLFFKMAALELICEKKGIDQENIDNFVNANGKKIQQRMQDNFLDSTPRMLSE